MPEYSWTDPRRKYKDTIRSWKQLLLDHDRQSAIRALSGITPKGYGDRTETSLLSTKSLPSEKDIAHLAAEMTERRWQSLTQRFFRSLLEFYNAQLTPLFRLSHL